jgi:hypothetical protein
MKETVLGATLFIFAVVGGGCSLMAPPYTASIDNVQRLKDAGDVSVKVGQFDSSPDRANANPISLRGSSLSSPYNDSYAAYLAEAIKQELALAGKLKPDTDIEISGLLLKNDLDTSGFVVATGDMEARFVVKKMEEVRYNQVKTVHREWESSFLGSIAIPRAQEEYPRLVQQLLQLLYGDNEFLQALK